jgi:hypothetical protein
MSRSADPAPQDSNPQIMSTRRAAEILSSKRLAARLSMPPDDRVELLTQQEAALFLHKSLRVLRFWRTAGIGPPYAKLGKTVLYDRIDLVAYVRSNTVQPSVRAAIEEDNRGAL